MENPVIPHMRDVLMERAPAAPVNPQGPALLSVLVFFAMSAVGVILRLLTGGDSLFLVSLIAGCIFSIVVYFASRRMFRSYSGSALFQQASNSYIPLLAKIYAWGFEAAAKAGEEIVAGSLPLSESKQREFAAIDESLHMLLTRICQLGQAKLLIGNERELKKHCDKLSLAFASTQSQEIQNVNIDAARIELAALELRLEKLEQISQTAVIITQELTQLKQIAESVWTGEMNSTQGIQLLLQHRQKCQERLTSEMNKLGL